MAKDPNIRLIDKPPGITSFDVIRYLRRMEGISKAGHAGTLDPLASGLLVIGVGKEGTRRLTELTGLDKTYLVTAELGRQTDTGDLAGKVIKATEISEPPAPETVRSVLEEMTGTLDLPVPRYSAVKVGGERLYKKARRGEDFTPPKRPMQLYQLRLKGLDHKDGRVFLKLEMSVASGVYVRSVVEELGRRLDLPATTFTLRRTRVGEYRVEEASKLPGEKSEN